MEYRLYKGAWMSSEDPHLEKELSKRECSDLLVRGGWFVRNVYDWDCEEETSFWYVIKDSFGGMDELSAKMRNQVKKCFKTMRVEKISGEFLKNNGYDVYLTASDSYRVKSTPPTRKSFEHRIANAEENDYWGCIELNTGRLVAFSMNKVTDQSCEYRTMKALPEYQKLYAYYGMIYEMNKYYLHNCGLKYVNDGARSITNHSNIQPFLIEKFNFRKAFCRLNIQYKAPLRVIVWCLFPFRKLISNKKIKALLSLEALARNKSKIRK